MEDNTPSEASSEEIREQIETTPETPSQTEAVEQEVQPESSSAESEQLLAGKFKTPEELEKGYLEAQKALTLKSQEIASSKNIADALYGQPVKEQITVPLENIQTEEEAQTYLNNLVANQVQQQTQGILSQVTPLVAELEVERVRAKYPEFAELLPHIQKVYEDYPEMRKPGNLERALRLAKADYLPEVIAEARQEGIQIANQKFDEAKVASTETVRSTSEGKTSPTDEEIANMSSSELLQYLKN